MSTFAPGDPAFWSRFEPLSPTPPHLTRPDCANLLRLAALGAIVGGSLAAARELQAFQKGAQNLPGVLMETARGATAAGLATAVGGAVASSLAEQGFGRFGMLFLTSVAVFYVLPRRDQDA